jgi:hypothetical protein
VRFKKFTAHFSLLSLFSFSKKIFTNKHQSIPLLDPEVKAVRVYNYHNKTVSSALDIIGTMGCESIDELSADKIMRRVRTNEVQRLSDHFPLVNPGCLLDNTAPERLGRVWNS